MTKLWAQKRQGSWVPIEHIPSYRAQQAAPDQFVEIPEKLWRKLNTALVAYKLAVVEVEEIKLTQKGT